MKKIVMLFLATMVLAGASFAGAQEATTKSDNAMASDTKSDTAAPKKSKKAKKEKTAKTKKAKKAKGNAAATPEATPAK